jgi:hypothetical protein
LNPHDPLALVVFGLVGIIAAGLNAVAGGGSLISFPTLVGFGVPPLVANATNAVALWPGSLTGALAFRSHFQNTKAYFWRLAWPTVFGSIVGALILVFTPDRVFRVAVPILILFATLLLAFQPRIKAFAAGREARVSTVTGAVLQFFVSVYGGYFGAGMGILMLAYLGLMLDHDIHQQNALKGWLGLIINFVASLVFVAKGIVDFPVAGAMLVGSLIGGYSAARLSLKINPNTLRQAIVAIGFIMVAWFTYRLFA